MPRYTLHSMRGRPRSRRWLPQAIVLSIVIFLLFQFPTLSSSSFSSPLSLFRSQAPRQRERVAFATLLLAPPNTTSSISESESRVKDGDGGAGEDQKEEDDIYFTSTRILTYQLLHSRSTRSRSSSQIPLLVLVPPEVSAQKRYQLSLEGATIIEVGKIHDGDFWVRPMAERWRDLMIKLRVAELLEWDKILFLDSDTLILHPMDGIFGDKAAVETATLKVAPRDLREAPLPRSYLFASSSEVLHTIHTFPPPRWMKFNAGFFMVKPSTVLVNYYRSLLKIEDAFESAYMEQELLNHAHRESGNMPWGRLDSHWNLRLPNAADVRKGVRSVHGKFWESGGGDGGEYELNPVDKGLKERWVKVRDEMEKFYKGEKLKRGL